MGSSPQEFDKLSSTSGIASFLKKNKGPQHQNKPKTTGLGFAIADRGWEFNTKINCKI